MYNKNAGYGQNILNSFTPYMGGKSLLVCADATRSNYQMLAEIFSPHDGINRMHATITSAVAAAGAWDTIYIIGTENAGLTQTSDYAESIEISDTQIGLRIIGCGNNYEGVLWTCETQDDYIVKVNANQVLLKNIRFRPNGATGGAIYLTNDATQQATGFQMEDCVIRSTTENAAYGIACQDRLNDLHVKNCLFSDLATYAIYQIGRSNSTYRWIIEDCTFETSCTAGVAALMNKSVIKNCRFGEFGSSVALSTASATVGGNNFIDNCIFEANGTIASDGEIEGALTDVWNSSKCCALSESNYTSADGSIITIPGTYAPGRG